MRRDATAQVVADEAPDRGAVRHEIRLLGPFTVVRESEVGKVRLTDQQIGSRKARTLIKRLLVERGRVVSVDVLAETLWPGHLPGRPDRHVATLVSRLRAAFGSDVVVREGEGYRFGDGSSYTVDTDEASRLTSEAEARLATGDAGLARGAADRALTLLGRGDLLADEPYAEWAVPHRAWALRLVRRARRSALAAALALHDLDRAARLAEAALAAEPFDEEACRALMNVSRDRGSPGQALAAYERLRKVLADDLGTDPSLETRRLHRAILRAEHGTAASGPPTSAPPAASWRPDPAVVGREAELARLRRAWSAAAAGGTRLVLLAGEAGIGKTRLANEVVRLAEVTGGSVVQARCYDAERSLFLQPVADALRPMAATVDPGQFGYLAELIPDVAGAAPPRDHRWASPEVQRRRVFEAVAGLVRTLADRAPLLLFLDDLHQAGSSTLELLHFLLRRVTGSRVLVLATVRVEEGAEVFDLLGALAERQDIGGLDQAAVRQLARRNDLTGLTDARADALTARVMARTRGHTLFVIETLRAMREEPTDPVAAPVPESLRAAVVARMRRAGRQVEELLRTAATLGGSFDPALIAALAGDRLEETARRADAAARARLLTEAGAAYEFANDLIQEIAYQTTPLPIRIAQHRRAAQLLKANPEAVAGHASRAGDWPQAMEAYLHAAEAAVDQHALRDARRLLEQALDAAIRADDQVGVARARLARGQVREALADYQGAYEDHTVAAEIARSRHRPELELAALSWLGGDLLVGMRRPTRECIPYLEAALTLAESTGDVPGQVDTLGRLAVIWTNRLRFDLARSHAERALMLASPREGEGVRALALDAVKTARAYCGDMAGLVEVLPRLHASLERYGRPRLRYRQPQLLAWATFESAFPALARADWPEVVARINRALGISRETGYTAYRSPFLVHLAWVERARGRYGEALRHARQAAEVAGETGHPWWVALAETMLGWILTETGGWDEAVARLERGLAAAERDATEGYLLRSLGHLAWAASLRGERDRAASLAGRAETLLEGVTGAVFLHGGHAGLAVAAARLALGDAAAAARLAEPLREAAAEAGWVETVAWADLLLARCRRADHPRHAAALATGALAAAERHVLPGLAWHAHLLLAELPAADREARAHRATAAIIVDELAGTIDDPELRDRYRVAASGH